MLSIVLVINLTMLYLLMSTILEKWQLQQELQAHSSPYPTALKAKKSSNSTQSSTPTTANNLQE